VSAFEAPVWYSYAIVRVVPRVERGECVNVGIVLFVRERRYLAARIDLDVARLRALAPDLDVALVERHLATFLAICEGQAEGGPLSDLPPAERFHWLVAPRSTIIQTSPAHIGRTTDPAAELQRLLDAYVRLPHESQSTRDRASEAP
jgi:hypothetical protein